MQKKIANVKARAKERKDRTKPQRNERGLIPQQSEALCKGLSFSTRLMVTVSFTFSPLVLADSMKTKKPSPSSHTVH